MSFTRTITILLVIFWIYFSWQVIVFTDILTPKRGETSVFSSKNNCSCYLIFDFESKVDFQKICHVLIIFNYNYKFHISKILVFVLFYQHWLVCVVSTEMSCWCEHGYHDVHSAGDSSLISVFYTSPQSKILMCPEKWSVPRPQEWLIKN